MYSELLTALQPAMCSGLYAQLLHRKANAQKQQQQYGAALQSLDSALEWEPEDASCLQSRAMVCALHVHSTFVMSSVLATGCWTC